MRLMGSPTRVMAQFTADLSYRSLPREIERKAQTCLLNGFGIGLGCLTSPHLQVAREAALGLGSEKQGGATILGDGRRVSVISAALANSALLHARGQDDACGAAHFGAPALATASRILRRSRVERASQTWRGRERRGFMAACPWLLSTRLRPAIW
jgi:2-methylcitrate dehydratase PrpD